MEEWGALPGHGMANFHGDKIWLILGLIRERMTDEQRAAMLAHMPPPALEMWTGFGEQAFKEYAAEGRGGGRATAPSGGGLTGSGPAGRVRRRGCRHRRA